MKKKIVGLCFFTIFFAKADLDPSFGVTGIATTSINQFDIINGVIVEPTTSNIIVAGLTSIAQIPEVLIGRYTDTGVVDTTFNSMGTTPGFQTTLIGSEAYGNALVLQSSGEYVVCGVALESQANIAVLRYTSAGQLDITFNSVGFRTDSVGTGASGNSVKVRSTGEIVVGGAAVIDGHAHFTVAQYSSSGALDTSFGGTGIVTTSIETHAVIDAIAIQDDGNIVAGGFAHDGSSTFFALARYNTDGTLDTSFGVGGTGIVTQAIGSYARIKGIAIQSDDAIVVAGTAIISGIEQVVVARYTSAGVLDTSFNGSGIVITNLENYSAGKAVTIQDDGSIIVGGFSSGGNGSTVFAILRYTTTGALDTTGTFAPNGFFLTEINGANSESVINSVALSPEVSLPYVIATGFSNSSLALAAYTI